MALTNNKNVLTWVKEMEELMTPDKVVWIDGSEEQLKALREEAFSTGEMQPLNEELLPGCMLHHTAKNDVARVEDRTFICTKNKEDAAPINNWMVYRRDEGPHHVRHSVLHGPHRLAVLQGGR